MPERFVSQNAGETEQLLSFRPERPRRGVEESLSCVIERFLGLARDDGVRV